MKSYCKMLTTGMPARNAYFSTLLKPKPARESIPDRQWRGKLKGDFQGIGVAWDLSFELEFTGHQFRGSGSLRGSATHDEDLAFGLLGDSRIDPAEGSATMTVAVNDPLPKDEDAFMRFELTDLEFASPYYLESHFRLSCLHPSTCGCSGGSGTFKASKK